MDIEMGAVHKNPPKNLSQEEILELKIEDLGLSSRVCIALKRAGILDVKGFVTPRPEEMMGVRNLGRKTVEELIVKLKELGIEIYEEQVDKYPGHEKCNQLREIRKKIAVANNIEFAPAVCTHKGPCLGTCPVCDEEISYLDRELQKKKENGEEIILIGIAEDDIRKSKVDVPIIEDIIGMGIPILDDFEPNIDKTEDTEDAEFDW